MNLHSMLAARAAEGRPVRMALVGAGKFGSMILAQARLVPGLHVVAVADLDPARARASFARVGWEPAAYAAPSAAEALRTGATWITDDAAAVCAAPGVDCVVEATGHPLAGVRHALAAIAAGKHLVMVNVEADAMCGPALAARARAAGLVYSMAYGDQPALICELVDWARSNGFEVVGAGKGMKFEPHFRYSTPDTVWTHYGFTAEDVAKGDFNPRMFNSFTDGTKSAIEMTAVANGTGLDVPDGGLAFPPAGKHDLAQVFRPAADGGRLARAGLVDIAASQEPDGREVANNIRWGVFVTFRAPTAYARDCFRQYGMQTDSSGWYGAMYRPYHMIGLETATSVLSAVLRNEPTGTPREFRADAVAFAKAPLRAGDVLDGEGGFAVYADAVPAARSLADGALPIGLAHGVRLRRDVAKDGVIRFADVDLRDDADVLAIRRAMEGGSPASQAAAAAE